MAKTQRPKPTPAPDEVAHWSDVLTGLRQELATATDRLAELGERRKELALGAHTGNLEAKRALDAITVDQRAAEDERGDIEAAIHAATANLERARRAIVEADKLALIGSAEALMARVTKRAALLTTAQQAHAELLRDHLADMVELQRALKAAALDLITDPMIYHTPEWAFAAAHMPLAGTPAMRWIRLPPSEMRRTLTEHVTHIFGNVRTTMARKRRGGGDAPQAEAAD